MQIALISISSVNTITIIVVITHTVGYRQQFLSNTATKRHPRNTTNPTLHWDAKLWHPSPCHNLKTELNPSGESEGASQALCNPPPFPSAHISNQLPPNSTIPLKATRQQVCQESSIQLAQNDITPKSEGEVQSPKLHVEHHLRELVNISHYLDSQDLFGVHVCIPAYVPHRRGAPRSSWPASIARQIPAASPAHANLSSSGTRGAAVPVADQRRVCSQQVKPAA